MRFRDHEPVEFSSFKGLWRRGDPDNTPLDHLAECNNLMFVGDDLTLRDGIGISQIVAVPIEDVKRIYNYPTQTANTQIVLTYDGVTGKIYHVVNATTVYEILSIAGMTDFAFIPYAGRGYISPFGTFVTGDLNIQKGLQNEFLYVYLGAGVAARKAAGATPAGTLSIAAGAAGNTDPGFHIFAVVGEADSGFLSEPFAFAAFTTLANNSVSFGTVPVLIGAQWVKRHIVATEAIVGYNGDLTGYPFFFIPNATINNNTDLFINNISFFDSQLLDDASHLIDNFSEIPAGAALSLYHDRLCISTTFNDISIVLISAPGEPEAISEIDGLIIVPLDGNPITNHQELRDIFYVFKRTRCVGYMDNGEEPANWKMSVVDNALGTSVHGIATVLDSGSSSVDFLIIANYAGIYLFNGNFIIPELSWKIQDLWFEQDRDLFRKIQIVNAPIQGWIVIVLPDGSVLIGDYNNGMDPKNIRWLPWSFRVTINAVAIVNIDEIVLGADI